jgi:hypothetical protein
VAEIAQQLLGAVHVAAGDGLLHQTGRQFFADEPFPVSHVIDSRVDHTRLFRFRQQGDVLDVEERQ